MNRMIKSHYYLTGRLGFVLLLGFIALGTIGGCNSNGGGGETQQGDCREPFGIISEVPVAVRYDVVGNDEECLPPSIGNVREALRRKAREYCAAGECDNGTCKPKNVLVTINRQLGTFSRPSGVDGRKECWVAVEAKMSTRCVCE